MKYIVYSTNTNGTKFYITQFCADQNWYPKWKWTMYREQAQKFDAKMATTNTALKHFPREEVKPAQWAVYGDHVILGKNFEPLDIVKFDSREEALEHAAKAIKTGNFDRVAVEKR